MRASNGEFTNVFNAPDKSEIRFTLGNALGRISDSQAALAS
jgi:hypothetical protein